MDGAVILVIAVHLVLVVILDGLLIRDSVDGREGLVQQGHPALLDNLEFQGIVDGLVCLVNTQRLVFPDGLDSPVGVDKVGLAVQVHFRVILGCPDIVGGHLIQDLAVGRDLRVSLGLVDGLVGLECPVNILRLD